MTWQRARLIALEATLPIVLLASWWLATKDSTSPYWPPLTEIFRAFRRDWFFDRVSSDLVPSLSRFAQGYAWGVLSGIGLGLVLGSSLRLRRALQPILEFIRAIPPAAVIPVAVIALGISDREKIFLIAFASVWPVLLNTVDGVRSVEPTLHDVARVYRFTRRQKVFELLLPAALPQIFVGLRLALATALVLIVISEMFASTSGLGFFILQAQQTYQTTEMWSGILMLAIVAFLVNTIFLAIERRALYWHRGWRASALGEASAEKPPTFFWRRRREPAAVITETKEVSA